jgi:outer membrane lipoprotein-sorting protein
MLKLNFGQAAAVAAMGVGFGWQALAQGAAASPDGRAPAQLSGKGLAQHDFVYSGESHERRIFIVRGGKIVWSYDDPAGKGEISDMVMLSNGNILFAHQFGVTEITQEKKVVWNYVPPGNHEVHTAVPIGNEHVLYIENGDPNAVLRVVNIVTGAVEKEFPLDVKKPVSVHGQFRHARLTANGTVLVAHHDLDKVVEYDASGKEVWAFPGSNPWSANPLVNGNVLITDHLGVREVTRHGDTVWTWKPADTPDYKFASLQQAWRLPNGDTVINNWVNEWNKTPQDAPGSAQAIELNPAKQVVWALREWTVPTGLALPGLGPATSIQFLDAGSDAAPENVHFGDIH